MAVKVLMPALSPTMTEGNLANWLKKEGDKIKAGDVIAEIETDKAVMEVEAVDEGILGKILVPAGSQSVKVNELIAVILEDGDDKSAIDALVSSTGANPVAAAPVEAKVEAKKEMVASAPMANKSSGDRIFASPLAKRIAANESVDISNVSGTGPHGRVIKDDVMNHINSGGKKPAAKVCNMPANFGRSAEEYTKVPNNNMRKVIAKRLCESKQTIPHFYLNIECQIDKLMAARQEMNNSTDKDNPAYKISVNDLVIKAVAMALRDVPDANASWTDEAILKYNNVDISVAVAIDGGLITPIVKNADKKTVSSISNEMKDLASRARSGKLAPEEFQGGGFSISNLGMYGIKNFNAIINPPQSCILAIGTSIERALVENGNIKIANIMEVTLSCDHRVVDGAVGAKFLAAFKKYIENPMGMLV